MENVSIHEKIIRGTCRLCLCSDGGALIDMFSFSSELKSKISEAVTKCTSIHVDKTNKLPTTICEPCYMQLIKTQNFQMLALKSDRTLQVYLQRLRDEDKQNILASSTILSDSYGSSAAKQTNEDNSEEIKPDVKYSERGCEDPEMNIIEKQIFAVDRSHMKWDIHNKDSVFYPNLIVKAEPINNKDSLDKYTEVLSDYPASQNNIKSEIEVSNDKMTTSYRCDVCNKHFSNPDILGKHQRIHTSEKPYHCDLCNTSMIDLNNFKEHLRVHTEEKPYQCDVCNKCFRISGSLIKHQRVHTGEKPYQCDVCAKCFSNSANLRRHQRVHSGEKPYQCDVCNKSFSFSSAFKSHHRIHTGEKPYKCNMCSKCFTSSSFLIVHKRTHTGEKPYQCDVCNKRFSISTTLKIHQRVHTGEKPYQCDICNKGFSQLCALNNHKRKHSSDA